MACRQAVLGRAGQLCTSGSLHVLIVQQKALQFEALHCQRVRAAQTVAVDGAVCHLGHAFGRLLEAV